MKKSEPEVEIEQFIKECREKGLSITTQRIAIYRDLLHTTSHPTAEEVHAKLHSRYPALSLATVYKTLETFERNGFATKTRATGEKARYDGNRKPHHHFICKVCQHIEDIYDDRFEFSAVTEKLSPEFEVHDYHVDFYGICKNCRTKNRLKDSLS